MIPRDRTSMGGNKTGFTATPWSLVFNAQTADETRRRLLLNDLTKVYWKPIYCYLFRKGYSNELLAAIDWAMEVDPELRPQIVDQLLEALEAEGGEPQMHQEPETNSVLQRLTSSLPWKRGDR